MLLRVVDGRPLSTVIIAFLTACCDDLARPAVPALVLIGDNTSWRFAPGCAVTTRWPGQPARACASTARCPSRVPGFNPIEATWVHSKRNASEADRLLSADELEARVHASSGVPRPSHLVMPTQVVRFCTTPMHACNTRGIQAARQAQTDHPPNVVCMDASTVPRVPTTSRSRCHGQWSTKTVFQHDPHVFAGRAPLDQKSERG